MEVLGLADLRLAPYSLSRGGATLFFRTTGSLDKTMEMGCWSTLRACRVYVNTALAEFTSTQLRPEVEARLRALAQRGP